MTDTLDARNLIFIGGAPRSGTTLVQRVLSCHSLVYGGPEFDHVPSIMRLRNAFHESVDAGRISSYLGHDDVDEVFRDFVLSMFGRAMKNRPGKTWFSEKTPSNAEVFAELSETFPDSKVIFVVRDPRAVVASMLEVGDRFRKEGHSPEWFTKNTRAAVRYINQISAAGFAEIQKGRLNFMVVFYEDFVSSPEETIRDLAQRVGLEFEVAMVEIEKTKTVTADFRASEHLWYSKERLQSGIDTSSLEKWRDRLSKYDLFVINRRLARFPGVTDRHDVSCPFHPLYFFADWAGEVAVTVRKLVKAVGKRLLS